jgi:hypothetical protein
MKFYVIDKKLYFIIVYYIIVYLLLRFECRIVHILASQNRSENIKIKLQHKDICIAKICVMFNNSTIFTPYFYTKIYW